MPEPEPNPHVELNNAREAAKQERHDRIRREVGGLCEDKARLDFLISNGATWQIPFVEDEPHSFNRDVIDAIRRKYNE